jgi:MFS family permease
MNEDAKTTEVATDTLKSKWVIVVLLLVTPLVTMLPYLAMAVLMNDIMETLNIGLSLAGLSMTVMLAISGLCMFIGSNVQGKIGVKSTILIAMWLLFLGAAVCFIAPNFAVFFIGRIITGVGFGLFSISLMPYLSAWFKGNQRTFMVTISMIMSSVASIISLSVANPIAELAGTWQAVFGAYAVFIALIALLWTLFGKSNKELDAVKNPKAGTGTPKQKSALREAFGIKQFRNLMICSLFVMSAFTALTAFMPTYLQNERGFSLGFSVMAANVQNVTFIVGAILGGIIMARTGKRKRIFQAGIIAVALGGLLFSFASAQAVIMFAVSLIGMGFMLRVTAQTTLTMETLAPPNPVVLGGAMAIIGGVGQLASLIVAPAFGLLSGVIGMAGAFQVFFSLAVISIIVSFMVRETGPGAIATKTE